MFISGVLRVGAGFGTVLGRNVRLTAVGLGVLIPSFWVSG